MHLLADLLLLVLVHSRMHQCTRAAVHQCATAAVHQCTRAVVHQCTRGNIVNRLFGEMRSLQQAACACKAALASYFDVRNSSPEASDVQIHKYTSLCTQIQIYKCTNKNTEGRVPAAALLVLSRMSLLEAKETNT